MKKYLPTWYIVKEIKFKRKHKMSYSGYIKNKYKKHCNNMKSDLYKNNYDDLLDYFIMAGMLFTFLLTGILHTFGLGILLLLSIWFPVSYVGTLTIFSITGITPLFYSIICYPYYWCLIIFNKIFNIDTKKKTKNSKF